MKIPSLPPFPKNSELEAKLTETSAFESAVSCVLAYFSRENLKTTVVLLYAVFALTAWKYIPSAPQFANVEGACVLQDSFGASDRIAPLASSVSELSSWFDFLWNARKLWGAFLLMGIGPALIVKYVFREKLADYGLRFGERKRTIVTFCAFLPLFLIMGWLSGHTKGFYAVYPFNPLAGASHAALIVHSVMYLLLYYLAWEFMFRGFMLKGLAPQTGIIPAILIQVLASTMLHYGHPASETFGCIAGGILWGFCAYRTKSILSGWGQHAVLGILLDWSLVMHAV